MTSTTLERIAKRDARVADVEDLGRDEESRYWIHLKQGWYSPNDGSHTITGRTVREAVESLALVTPCRCRECIPTDSDSPVIVLDDEGNNNFPIFTLELLEELLNITVLVSDRLMPEEYDRFKEISKLTSELRETPYL